MSENDLDKLLTFLEDEKGIEYIRSMTKRIEKLISFGRK